MEIKRSLWFKCPHCGNTNTVIDGAWKEYENVYRCNVEEGGCDSLLVVIASIEVNAEVFTVNEPQEA